LLKALLFWEQGPQVRILLAAAIAALLGFAPGTVPRHSSAFLVSRGFVSVFSLLAIALLTLNYLTGY
jgi:hypothetical protein